MKRLAVPFLLFLLALGLWACSTLSPGADPFVVRVEQGEAGSGATFDLVLRLDASDRGFWRTNAPAFHNFCEWLRTPTPYSGKAVPRCVAMQFNVDDLKLAYKASKTATSSNALYEAFSVLGTAVGQANSWSNIVTAPIH